MGDRNGPAVVATITDHETLDALIAAHETLAIGFEEDGAESSQAFRLAFEEVTRRMPQIAFRRVASTASNPLAAIFGIESAPALVLFRQGVGLFSGPAAFSAAQLEALLRRALALDIEKVREELRREREAESMIAMRRACPAGRRGNLA